MNTVEEELILFWRGLSENKVKYILVGSHAIQLHGVNSRATAELEKIKKRREEG